MKVLQLLNRSEKHYRLSVGPAKEKVLQVRSLDPKTQLLLKPHVLCFCRASFDEKILKPVLFWSVRSAYVTVLQPEKPSEEGSMTLLKTSRRWVQTHQKITKSYYIWTLTVKCGFCGKSEEGTKTCWSAFTWATQHFKTVLVLGSFYRNWLYKNTTPVASKVTVF